MSSTITLSGAQRWALPIFLKKENKYKAGILTFTVSALLYFLSNHYPIFEPQMLPMHWIDATVPFTPWTIWIYLSEVILFIAVYVLCKDMTNTNKYLYSFFALQIVSVAIFFIYPTTFPRDQFHLPENLNELTRFAFLFMWSADTPNNCAPSLHVSSCYLSSFIFLDEQKKKFPFFFGWASLVALSTLTTKQHYLIDVVLGFIFAVTIYWIFHRFIPYRLPNEDHAKQ